MTKELTAKDINAFNKLNRAYEYATSKAFKRRTEQLFEQSDYNSPVDFLNDFIEWRKGGEQLKLL